MLCGYNVVVDSLFNVAPDVCGGFVFGPFFFNSVLKSPSFAIIFYGKSELIALL